MPYQVQETDSLSRSANVTIPNAEFEQTVAKELRKLSKRVKVRGFRKGKTPLNVMRKQYGPAVQQDVVENLVRKYIDEIVKESDNVIFIDQPNVTSFGVAGTELVFDFIFELRPDLDPIGYLGMEVGKPKIEVSSDEIEKQIELLRDQMAVLEPIEKRTKIEEGDVVTFDFKAVDDDEALKEFNGKDAQVIIGDERTSKGINKALKGAKFDTTVIAQIDATEDFPVEIDAETFELELKISAVKKRVLPEVDDDFAVETGADVKTVAELKTKIEESLEEQKEHSASHIAQDDLMDKLLDQNKIDLPPKFLEQQVANGIQNKFQQMQQQGQNFADFDFEAFQDDVREESEERLRAEFLLLAIADKESLKLENEDIQKYYVHQARHAGVTPQQFAQYIQQDPNRQQGMAVSALLEKTLNHLLAEATLKEVKWPDPAEEAAKKAKKKKAKKKAAPKKAAPKAAAKKAAPKKAAKAEEKSSDAVDLNALKAAELKALCKENDLKQSGKKAELIERLKEAGVGQ